MAFNGDVDTAGILLDNIRVAQKNLGKGQHVGGGQPFVGLGKPAQTIPDGLGGLAATSELNTRFGFSYLRFLHIGATGWYAIAGQAGNPFRLSLGQTESQDRVIVVAENAFREHRTRIIATCAGRL